MRGVSFSLISENNFTLSIPTIELVKMFFVSYNKFKGAVEDISFYEELHRERKRRRYWPIMMPLVN